MLVKFLILLSFFVCSMAYSQSFLAVTLKKTDLKQGPSEIEETIMIIPKNSIIFIFSDSLFSGYYKALDIETNTEGFVKESYTQFHQKVDQTTDKVFSSTGKIEGLNPEVTVYNNTSRVLSLKLDTAVYSFLQQERRTFSVPPGTFRFFASAPGAIPLYGSQHFEQNNGYSWNFWIEERSK